MQELEACLKQSIRDTYRMGFGAAVQLLAVYAERDPAVFADVLSILRGKLLAMAAVDG